MSASHRKFDGAVDLEIISISMGGNPSGVSAAVLRVFYIDGTFEDKTVSPRPNEIMYETFLEEFNRLKASLTHRSK